jgi:ADP-heptose:LPS heptosyltransferase
MTGPYAAAVVMLRALGLGDFLTGVPAYRGLRAAFPEHEIVLAASETLAPLAALTGAIDRVCPTGELQPIDWHGRPPDVAIDLHGSGPLSHRIVTELGARRTMQYASPESPEVEGPWWHPGEREVRRWCRLLEWHGVPADPDDLALARPADRHVPRDVVVLHPGAASAGRRWPAERFAAVAKALWHAGCPIVLTGVETALSRRIAAEAGVPPGVVMEGTELLDLAALVASARLVISNDTGISHVATAYGTPSVTLFGPVSPALWGPPPDRPRHIALWHGTGFRPGDPHATDVDPRLLQISVEEVLDAARSLLGPRPDDAVLS